jgi:hypothetical protein
MGSSSQFLFGNRISRASVMVIIHSTVSALVDPNSIVAGTNPYGFVKTVSIFRMGFKVSTASIALFHALVLEQFLTRVISIIADSLRHSSIQHKIKNKVGFFM